MQAVAGRWLQALTEGSGEVVMLVAADGRPQFVSMSQALVDMVGYGPEELSQLSDLSFVHPDDQQLVVASFREVSGSGNGRTSIDYRVRHRLGHWVRVQSTAVNRLADEVVQAVVVHTRPMSSSDQPPVSDPGTVGDDRASFAEAVQAAVDRARTDPRYGFSVLLLELERFKMLVGSYGQELVGQLLNDVAGRVAALLRPQDTLGRLSGGEIAILLDGVGDRRHAGRVADRVQKTVSRRYALGEHVVSVSGYIGIATSERIYERSENVMRDAALAANRARSKGHKRRAVFQTQMRVEDTRFMALVAELHAAVQEKQFRLYYQPIISLATRGLIGFEALLRWNHPKHGIVPPVQFIPIAEETGLIAPLGEWVLNEACRQMTVWTRTHPRNPPLHISVNLSAKQFADEDLTGLVERALQSSGLPGGQLKLEVTESAVLESREEAAETLNRLKQQGVKVSLDDFGTGYSSFSYLHQLPYDTIKIDRSFVARIGEDGENTDVIHAIIVLAHNLRMDVVAEGVETARQAQQLEAMWCESAQGYFFARPLEASAAEQLIATNPRW